MAAELRPSIFRAFRLPITNCFSDEFIKFIFSFIKKLHPTVTGYYDVSSRVKNIYLFQYINALSKGLSQLKYITIEELFCLRYHIYSQYSAYM
ncbi:MAG: hypothetical protein BWX96_02859 [Bacteroidetes bacterium ADurb.Bin145]|nr:MAG: hypothetical protein BWX96_02859 [Bacteroidetes bacterium ADurb.Bin145]